MVINSKTKMQYEKIANKRPDHISLKANTRVTQEEKIVPDASRVSPSDVVCPICYCRYTCGIRRPKHLETCLHTFCAPCLETLGTGMVNCPLCRHDTFIRDVQSLSDDIEMLRRVATCETLYPQLSPLKPPPPQLAYEHHPETPIKRRSTPVADIPASVLRPPAWNPDFSTPVKTDQRRAKSCHKKDSRKRTAHSYRSRPNVPNHRNSLSPESREGHSSKARCSECGYKGQHASPSACTSASEYYTAPDQQTTDFTSDDSLSSVESIGSSGETTTSGVWRSNYLSNKRRRKRYISANTPLNHMVKHLSQKKLRRSNQKPSVETTSNNSGCQAGELCSLRLNRVLGEFSSSPDTPGCFRTPNHVTVSRFNNHIAVVDSTYASVQVFNETGSSSISMIYLNEVTASCFVSADTIVCSNHLGIHVYNYKSAKNPKMKKQIFMKNVVSLSPYRGDSHEGAFIAVQPKAITIFSGSRLHSTMEIRRRHYPRRVFRKQVPFRTLVDCTSTSHGDLIALDSKTAKLYLMDRRGCVLLCIESRKETCGRFVNPTSVAVDSFNDIYVTDKDRVTKFSAQGLFSRTVLRVTGHLAPKAITTYIGRQQDEKQSECNLLVAMCSEQKSQAHVRIYSI